MEHAKPLACISENLAGLTHQRLRPERILKAFRSAGYVVHWKLLNSRAFCVAQCRKRVYMVCVLDGVARETASFRFPEPVGQASLGAILEQPVRWQRPPSSATACRNLANARDVLTKSSHVDGSSLSLCDLQASPKRMQTKIGYSPCITRARCGSKSFVVCKGRNTELVHPLTLLECSRLQGFSDETCRVRQQLLGDVDHLHALGNAMTQTVVEAVVQAVLPHISM